MYPAKIIMREVESQRSLQIVPLAGDLGVLAPLLSQAHRNLELYGKDTGAPTDHVAGNRQVITVTINVAPAKDDDDSMPIDVVPE